MARSYIALDTHCISTDMAVVNVAGKLILTQQAPNGDEKSGALVARQNSGAGAECLLTTGFL
jgi:hypothetical protein